MPQEKHQQKKLSELKRIFGKKELIKMFKPYYVGLLALLILVSTYHLYYARRLIPGVYIAGLKLGGSTYDQAVEKLQKYEAQTDKKLILSYEGSVYELSAANISLTYDWGATVNRAFEVGRSGNVLIDAKDKLAGFFKNLYIAAYYDYDDEAFSNFLATIRGDLNSPAENAHFFIKNDTELGITEETSGQEIDNEKLHLQVVKSFDDFKFGNKTIYAEPSEPDILAKDLEKVKSEAEKIVFNPIKLVFKEAKESDEWIISKEQKLNLINYEFTSGKLKFNKIAFQSLIEEVTHVVNRLPKGRVTETDGDRVIKFEFIQPGREIDVDATSSEFESALFSLKNEAEVKIKSIDGSVHPEDYGIFALLGEGNSWFTGSAQGRIHNLTLATERTDGVLVPPGVTYSLNESVGEISAATGYDAAWIILGNKTVLGHGGGVCQTSTTLFRAILDAGLPVVSRHPHAYRVYYYEINSPIGIDASIYQPTLDLQFKNDTANYVLVQTSINLEEDKLTFKLYGTPDGREVEISEPVVTNQSSAPAPLYQDDPTLPKGVVRQIDFAASGANVSFTRKVTRNGEVIYDDTFKTNYRPWRAVYLVGTKEN